MSADRFVIDDVAPTAVVRPANVAEISDWIERARAEKFGLFPIGGGTHRSLGLPPSKSGCVIDMTGLDQVIDYAARDMTVTVRTGITIAKLQAMLATENQRLPIDVALADHATLGGIVAVNASGPRRFGFGTLRDYVIGISFMTDEGKEVKAGGRVVKNVAGYDLCKLQIGALGTLGIVTQITLKLKPLAERIAVVQGVCGVTQLPDLLERLHATATRPVSINIQGMSGRDSSEVRFSVGFEDNTEAVDWQLQKIRSELAPTYAITDCAGPEAERVLQGITDTACRNCRVAFKANLLSSRVPEFWSRVCELAGWNLTSYAGNGIVLGHSDADDSQETITRALGDLRALAVSAQGNLVVTQCPSAWKSSVEVWGAPRGDLAVMRAIKRELDPNDLFNPGRFLV